MESDSPPPLQRSRAALLGPSLIVNPSKPLQSPLRIFFVFFFLCSFSSVASTFSDSSFEGTYSRLCNQIVPVTPLQPQTGGVPGIAKLLRFRYAYFSGGDRLLNKTSHFSAGKHTWFLIQSVQETGKDGVYEVRAQLRLWNRKLQPVQSHFRRLQGKVYRRPRIMHWRAGIDFVLRGLWSESSGKLCMVGTDLYGKMRSVILKLNYPIVSTIFNSFINGTLESIDDQSSLLYFEPISIIALSQNSNYEYSIGGRDKDIGCLAEADGENLPLNNFSEGACTVFNKRTDMFELKYESDCRDDGCYPLGASVGYLPEFMYFYGIRCVERQKVQMLLGFPDPSYQDTMFPFDPKSTLISEGTWDEKKNRLCAVACRILNFSESFTDAYVGDCSLKLTLRFPSILSLRNRNTILGQIWSNKAVDESGYLSKIEFQGSSKVQRLPLGFQYKYTEIDTVRKSCAEDKAARGKKMYPNGNSSDMRFSMLVTNSKGQVTQGYSSPLFVSDQIYDSRFYGGSFMLTRDNPKVHMAQLDNHSNLLNISYTISFKPSADFKFGSEGASAREVVIFAEGIYNSNTGLLCMIGCWHLRSTDRQQLMKHESLDCELLINVQFPPLNAKVSESVEGTIKSRRVKSDPYYFEPLQLSSSSIYTTQVEASIWRMDLEIILLLILNTLSCVFVGFQLLYVKKHPDVLPYTSIVMLIILTLGHMIPLLLNFEALLIGKHSQENVFLGSGGWLEVNEIAVRMVTMVAFLLELRLLQMTWSSRQGEGRQPGCWVSEKKVLFVTLPLYLTGGLTAWLVNRWKTSQMKIFRPFRLSRHRSHRQFSYRPPSIWEDLKSLAGLLLDGFLLPQILFNVFFKSEGKALTSSFYVGTTIVRILPHAYDLYRAHSSAWYLDLSYIYANHRMDMYSTAWDIIVTCGGVLFSLLIYLQQRFGGRCILPKRLRESSSYEKVPVIGNDDL